MKHGATMFGIALSLAGASAGGCGRVEYTPLDAYAPALDGAAPDAAGLDAGGVDASGLDAGDVDAGGLDAGGLDAGGLDAGTDIGGGDAGPRCRASVTWVDGAGPDGIGRIAQGPGRAVFAHVVFPAGVSTPGWPTGEGTLRLDDGVPGWFWTNAPTDLYFDGTDLWVATSSGIERLDPVTGALRGTLGPVTGAGYMMVASSGAGRVFAGVDCAGASGASWDGTTVSCGDSDLAFFLLDDAGSVLGAHLGEGPGSDDLGDTVWTGSDFAVSVGAQMSPFCVAGVCSGAGGPTRTFFASATDGAPRGFTSLLGSPFVSLACDAEGNLYGGGADLASVPPGAGRTRWLSDGPGFPRIGLDAARSRVYYAGRLVRPTLIGGVTVSPLGAESIAIVGLDQSSGALVEQHVFGDEGPYSVNGVAVDDRGRITVLGDTATSFVACPGDARAVLAGQAAFVLTIDP